MVDSQRREDDLLDALSKAIKERDAALLEAAMLKAELDMHRRWNDALEAGAIGG